MKNPIALTAAFSLLMASRAVAVKSSRVTAPSIAVGLGMPISIAPPTVSLTPSAAQLGGPALIPLSPSVLTAPAAIGPAPAPLAPSALKATPAAAKSDGPEPAEAAVPAAAVEHVSPEERALARTQLADIAAALEDETPGLALEKAFDNDPIKLQKAVKVIVNRADFEKAGQHAVIVRALEYARTHLHRNPRTDATRKLALNTRLRESLASSVEQEAALPAPTFRAFKTVGAGNPAIASSPDGQRLFIAGTGSVRMLDTATGEEIRKFEGPTSIVWGPAQFRLVALGPDGHRLFTGTSRSAQLWDTAAGEIVREFTGHRDWITSIVPSPDGRHLFTGSADRTARMWDIATGEEIRSFEGHTHGIHSMALSADGRHLFTGGADSTARLWDIATGKEIRKIEGHQIDSVAQSPNGRHLFTGGHDGMARMWDIATGGEIRKFESASWIEALALSPDGRHLFAGGNHGKARMWDIATGMKIRDFEGPDLPIDHISLSLNGRRLFASGGGKIVLMWDFEETPQEDMALSVRTLYDDLRSLISDEAAIDRRKTRAHRKVLLGLFAVITVLNPVAALLSAPVFGIAAFLIKQLDGSDPLAREKYPFDEKYRALHKQQLKLQKKTLTLAAGFADSREAPNLLAAGESFEVGVAKLLEHPQEEIRRHAARILAEALIHAAVTARENGAAPETAAYYAYLLDPAWVRSPEQIQQSLDEALRKQGFEDNLEFLRDFDALRESHHEADLPPESAESVSGL